MVLVLLIGAALRLYPVHRPYVGEDTQEGYPRAAMVAVAEGHWRPRWIVHGPGFFDALRALYSVEYGVGRLAGWYRDRLDLLASYVARPLPFLIAARLVVVACGLLAIALVARLGRHLDPPAGGVVGAAFLAVTFAHVRESHQVWPDVPAGTLVLAAIATSLIAMRRSSVLWSIAASALAGLAVATKPSSFPVVLPVALSTLLAAGRFGARIARVLLAGLAVVAVYLVAAPYVLYEPDAARMFLERQYDLTVGSAQGALPLGRLIVLGLGLPLTVIGGLGAVAAARRRRWREWVVVTAFPTAYLIVLCTSGRLFVRYMALLAPFVALFAGYAVARMARAMAPRHAEATAAILLLALAARPAALAVEYDRFLARDDTRSLAGAWLAEHAPPNAAVTIPDATGYVNPVLPPTTFELRRHYRNEASALGIRLGAAVRGWTVTFRRDSPGQIGQLPARESFVVTNWHPALFGHLNTPMLVAHAIAKAGGRPVATFVGTPNALPPEVSYDPIDADFVPLRGWDALARPGPNLTIWELPAAAR